MLFEVFMICQHLVLPDHWACWHGFKKNPSPWMALLHHLFSSTYPVQGHRAAGAHPRVGSREHPRWQTPWQTQRDRQPFTTTANLDSPINLTHTCFWTVGRSQLAQRAPTQAQGTTQTGSEPPTSGFESGALLLWGSSTNLATTVLLYNKFLHLIRNLSVVPSYSVWIWVMTMIIKLYKYYKQPVRKLCPTEDNLYGRH